MTKDLVGGRFESISKTAATTPKVLVTPTSVVERIVSQSEGWYLSVLRSNDVIVEDRNTDEGRAEEKHPQAHHHADEARQLDIREVRPRAACTLERLHLSSGPTLGLQGRLDKVHFFRTKQTYFFRMVNTHFVRPFRSEQFFEIMHLFDHDSSNGRPRSHGAVLW